MFELESEKQKKDLYAVSVYTGKYFQNGLVEEKKMILMRNSIRNQKIKI